MSDDLLRELLDKPVGPEIPARKTNPERDFTKQVEVTGDVAAVTVRSVAGGVTEDLAVAHLRAQGLDPAAWVLTGFRSSEWTMPNGETGVSTRFTFARKGSAEAGRPPLDELIAGIKEYRPKAKRPEGDHGYLVLLGDMQFGKALADETPVLTTEGWRAHGEIRPGMFVYGPNGQPVRVLAVTGSTEQDLYEVEFDRGVKVRASGDHGWQGFRRYHPSDYRNGGPTWEWREVLVTTRDLASMKSRPLNVPLAAPIEMPEQDLPIDPYVLGLWLGDGSSYTGTITLDERDADAISHLGRRIPSNERAGLVSVRVEGLTAKLSKLGLIGNKRVPREYLFGSVEQRLALLQGLMDTDGSCAKSGVAEFCNTNPMLTEAVKWLLSSLGFKYTARKSVGKLNGVERQPFERITFPTRRDMSVFRFPRKAERQRAEPQDQTLMRQVRRVTYSGRGMAQCLTVEGGLYLAGEELVVTHNCDGDGVEGTLHRTINCLNEAADLLVTYRKRFDIGHVHVAFLGDHIEGFNSQNGANVWRTTLTLNEQIRLTRRVMLHALTTFAPLAERVTMAAVPGNHGEAVRFAGKGVTRYDDSHDTEALIAVADAAKMNPDAFGHVEFYVPQTDELTVVLDVAGTVVAHAHGHQWRPGKHFEWWRRQAFNKKSAMHQADLLVAGHLHHELIDTDGPRTFIQTPAMESESTWWKHTKGTTGAPGLIVAVTKGGRTDIKEAVRSE